MKYWQAKSATTNLLRYLHSNQMDKVFCTGISFICSNLYQKKGTTKRNPNPCIHYSLAKKKSCICKYTFPNFKKKYFNMHEINPIIILSMWYNNLNYIINGNGMQMDSIVQVFFPPFIVANGWPHV